MTPLLRLAAITIATTSILGSASVGGQGTTRTIPYERGVPISARLVPSDTNVIVEKTLLSSHVSGRTHESFEQEVERWSVAQTIVLFVFSSTQGELTDDGAWVRSRFQGDATQFLKRPKQSTGSSIEFWHDGGTTTIGSVNVTAGVYPRFVVGERYLAFLAPDRARGTMALGLAFRVGASGYLEAMEWSDGTPLLLGSQVIGHSVSEVAAALK
jgi:hypothetical protein